MFKIIYNQFIIGCRTRQLQNHYKYLILGPYDYRYPPPTPWKYHFCHLISRRRSNAANYGKQTTSLPKTTYSLISNVYSDKYLYKPFWFVRECPFRIYLTGLLKLKCDFWSIKWLLFGAIILFGPS